MPFIAIAAIVIQPNGVAKQLNVFVVKNELVHKNA